jgi:hypothetical protein
MTFMEQNINCWKTFARPCCKRTCGKHLMNGGVAQICTASEVPLLIVSIVGAGVAMYPRTSLIFQDRCQSMAMAAIDQRLAGDELRFLEGRKRDNYKLLRSSVTYAISETLWEEDLYD